MRALFASLPISLFLALSTPAQTAGFVVFGDSLSDPGNFFAATGETVEAPFEPLPDAPYRIGGHHPRINLHGAIGTGYSQIDADLALGPSECPSTTTASACAGGDACPTPRARISRS